MSRLSSLGIGSPYLEESASTPIPLLYRQSTFHRVLNFLGYTTSDWREDRYARFRVLQLCHLAGEIERRCAEPAEQPNHGKIML